MKSADNSFDKHRGLCAVSFFREAPGQIIQERPSRVRSLVSIDKARFVRVRDIRGAIRAAISTNGSPGKPRCGAPSGLTDGNGP